MRQALRESWTADSTYLPALLPTSVSLLPRVIEPAGEVAARESFAAAVGDRELGACVRALDSLLWGWWRPLPVAPHASEAATMCVTYYRMQRPHWGTPAMRVRFARLRARRFPESAEYENQLHYELWESGAREEAMAVVTKMIDPSRPARMREMGFASLIQALHGSGRHAEAARLEQKAGADMRRQPVLIRLAYAGEMLPFYRALAGSGGSDSAVAPHYREVADSTEREMLILMHELDARTATPFRLARAEQLLNDGKLEASTRELDALVRLADSLDQPELLAHALVHRGRAQVKQGHTAEAERDLLAGRVAARRANHLQWLYESEHNLLHLYEATGRDAEARRAGAAFIALTGMGDNPYVELMANRDLAWYLQRRGERERARPYFETMLAFTDSFAGVESQWAGEYFELTGDLERAEAYFGEERARLAGRNQYRAYAALSRLAEATGDLNRALGYAREHDAGLEHAGYPEVAPLLPGLLARMGRVREAAREIERARRAALTRGQTAAWATLSADLSGLLLSLGEWTAAAAVADSAAAAATRVALAETRLRSEALAGLAGVYRGGAARADGLGRLRAAVRSALRIHVPELEAELLERQAEGEVAEGRPTTALALLARAADLTDSMATLLSHDSQRAGLRSAHLRISNLALSIVVREPEAHGAVGRYADWTVRRKGRGVLERGAGRAAPAGGWVRAVRGRLGTGDAVIDYAVLDTLVVALVVTNSGPVLRPLAVTAESLRARVGRLLAGLAPRMGNVVDTLHARFDTALAARLYADLLAPLEADLGARARLTIVADGPLHQLPFEALVMRDTRFALDRFTISYAPSLAVAGGGDQPLPGGVVLALAGPSSDSSLGGSLDEIRILRAAFGPVQVRTFSGAAATEAAIRAYAPTATLLHIAAHARANDADPASARIALAAADHDDGLLHAYEIDALRLPGSLVVLSACETGAGRLLGGEGVLSLSRAFLRAGARATIATLWPVGQGTASFMDRFYRDLAAGVPPASALRNAKLALARGPRGNPLYWAPFVLVSRTP